MLAAAGSRMTPSLAARALRTSAGDPCYQHKRTPGISELLFSRWCCPAGKASTLPERSASWRGRSPGVWEAWAAGDEASRRKLHTLDSGDHLVRGGVSSASCLNESSADSELGGDRTRPRHHLVSSQSKVPLPPFLLIWRVRGRGIGNSI